MRPGGGTFLTMCGVKETFDRCAERSGVLNRSDFSRL